MNEAPNTKMQTGINTFKHSPVTIVLLHQSSSEFSTFLWCDFKKVDALASKIFIHFEQIKYKKQSNAGVLRNRAFLLSINID